MYRHLLTLLAIAAAISAPFVVEPASAQEPDCGDCQDWFEEEEEEWVHAFGFGARFQCDGDGSVGCHSGPYYGVCSEYHDPGTGCQAVPEALDALLVASQLSDPEDLLDVAAEHSLRVILNDKARSLDVLSCEGTLVRRLSLTTAFLKELKKLTSASSYSGS